MYNLLTNWIGWTESNWVNRPANWATKNYTDQKKKKINRISILDIDQKINDHINMEHKHFAASME